MDKRKLIFYFIFYSVFNLAILGDLYSLYGFGQSILAGYSKSGEAINLGKILTSYFELWLYFAPAAIVILWIFKKLKITRAIILVPLGYLLTFVLAFMFMGLLTKIERAFL